jgi:polyhydroxybutyrate depolymerase
MRSAASLLAVLLLVAGPASSETVERRIDVRGRARTYLIHVPPGVEAGRRLPVVFVFHGAGIRSADMVRATGLDALADREKFLVVYPQALGAFPVYDMEERGLVTPSEDVEFVRALLERLRSRFPIDEKRICATGFSNGAAFCYLLAARMPEAIAAIAPVAGYLPRSVAAKPAKPVSLFHVHGERDDRVSAPGGANDPVAKWARWSGCTGGAEGSTFSGGEGGTFAYTVRRYACTGVAVESRIYKGLGHEWPDSRGGHATRDIWAFFRDHPKTGP